MQHPLLPVLRYLTILNSSTLAYTNNLYAQTNYPKPFIVYYYHFICTEPETPELLCNWEELSALGISKDGKYIVYSVGIPDVSENKTKRTSYIIPIEGGQPVVINDPDSLLTDKNISPDGKYLLTSKDVKVKPVTGSDFYPELSRSNVYIFDNLCIAIGIHGRWKVWPCIFSSTANPSDAKDIMPGQAYDCPQKPFGGDEDYVWNPDSKHMCMYTKRKLWY